MGERTKIIRSTEFQVTLGYLLILIVAGALYGFQEGLVADMTRIIAQPGVLITDFFVVGSIGATLVNAGLVGLAGLLVTLYSRVPIRGYIIAAVFTMAGFSFMGKTIANIWPVFLGVWLYALVKKEPFNHFILNALFGTALAPVASSAAFGLGLGPCGGLALGVAGGFLVPSLAAHFLATHQGLNLYNIGFTAGFIATLLAGLLRGFGAAKELAFIWGVGFNEILLAPLVAYLFSMIIIGVFHCRGNLTGLKEIHKMSGALVSDFVSESGLGATLINMGLVGLIGTGYVVLVGGDLNGPTLSGIFTIVGFGAFGKHCRNILPIMIGAFLSLQVFYWEAAAAGPLLGVLFGTTLAPIAGTFGVIAGLVAGFLHISMVMNVGYLHGGMNLYNNGFAGGIVAALMVGVLKSFNGRISDE